MLKKLENVLFAHYSGYTIVQNRLWISIYCLAYQQSLSCMQYRFKMQEKAVQPFLEYFRSSDRMVTVDVSSGAMEPIWDKVHEVFTAMDLVAWRPVESVLIFAMGEIVIKSVMKGAGNRLPLHSVNFSCSCMSTFILLLLFQHEMNIIALVDGIIFPGYIQGFRLTKYTVDWEYFLLRFFSC